MSHNSDSGPDLIYVVDDDAIFSRELYEILSINGYMVECFSDPLLFLSKVRHVRPDLIFMDIDLQREIDGVEIAKMVKEQYSVPIIFISGYDEKDLLLRIGEANPATYLTKPFSEREVLFNVAIILSRQKLTRVASGDEGTSHPAIQILTIKNGSKREKIEYNEIDYIQADSNYSVIFHQGKKSVSSQTLKKIELQLASDFLLRVHRKYIVNINKITGISRTMLFLGPVKVPIGISYLNRVRSMFQNI